MLHIPPSSSRPAAHKITCTLRKGTASTRYPYVAKLPTVFRARSVWIASCCLFFSFLFFFSFELYPQLTLPSAGCPSNPIRSGFHQPSVGSGLPANAACKRLPAHQLAPCCTEPSVVQFTLHRSPASASLGAPSPQVQLGPRFALSAGGSSLSIQRTWET